MSQGNRHPERPFLWHITGTLVIVLVGSTLWWGSFRFWNPAPYGGPHAADARIFVLAILFAYLCSLWGSQKILALPRCGRLTGVLSSAFLCCASASLRLVFWGRLYYSRPFWAWGFIASVLWIYGGHRLFFSFGQTVYAFLPGAVIPELEKEWRPNFVRLESMDFAPPYDVLVTPPTTRHLSTEWLRYVTNRTIQGIPIVHPAFLYEFFTGRMPIEHMKDERGFLFRPPLAYLPLKRVLDWGLLLLSLPPALILMGTIGILSLFHRPVFFTQERAGRNGVPFRIYKFRTMGPDGTVTRMGKFLRRHRLDELPQLLNILRGEMSFIGPRPEVVDLANRYAEEISFYSYRTSLLPGLTGWAQVNYGYASVTSENRIKLGYDLYYIKHASIALDALILLKTIRAVFTGFGAR